jgi:NadR type nicotinamide-nucleotide adenylyltransferase
MSKIIVLTGPESTAKSTLTNKLATYFKVPCFPEYAREYLAGKKGCYSYADVEHIARKQIEQYEIAWQMKERFVFLDTWLIITKVWFEWVFDQAPAWLEEAITNHPVDLFLLCRPDIPWKPDPLREHGGEQRKQLFQIYKGELLTYGFHFAEIDGDGEKRILNAIEAIKSNIYFSKAL